MPLVELNDVSLRYRGPALLDDVSCIIEAGQRIGLLGRNGAGKSSLLKLLTSQIEPDHGSIQCNGKVVLLQQDVPTDVQGTIKEVVLSAENRVGEAVAWEVEHEADQILSRMELDPTQEFGRLSSGMKRRVLLAQALTQKPDFLLLDEPTNHLDIDAITWLEDFLLRWSGTLMFVTHDRQFLRRLATRILEIDRGQMFDWSCDYDTFLKRKEQALEAQEKQDKLFDKKLAEEEAWIRQGIKARRTRNEGRVRALKELRRVREDRPKQIGTSNLQIQDTERSGNLVAKVTDVSFQRDLENGEVLQILSDFSTVVMRGDKVGIIGPNGAGKSTLLKVLLGELEPQSGQVRLGANLKIAYFDQLRAQLNGEQTVEQEVADGYDTVKLESGPRHVLGYLQDFLFTPERARTPIKLLSGGERNRVLLAKLFAKPANLIILDEPTNDLDAETLEMLEERLVDYQGTLIVVSHDREFLNNVVTNCLVFETDPKTEARELNEYVGGYDDWLQQRQARLKAHAKSIKKPPATPVEKPTQVEATSTPAKKKLSFKEQKELEGLPGSIESLETQIEQLHAAMLAPDFYKQAGDAIAAHQAEVAKAETALAEAYQRWEELEARA